MPNEVLHEQLHALATRLRALQLDYEQARDSRCVFTYAYAILTRQIDHDLDTSPLHDPAWIVRLALAFSDRYFQVVRDYDEHKLASPAWTTVLDAICRHDSSVLEDLLFAITAHIVHDLPLTLGDVGLTDANGASHLHDFDAVNDILGKAIDRIRDDVTHRYSPRLAWLDRTERHFDLILTDYGIRMSRALAWYNAQRLLDASCHDDALAAIERSPQVLVDDVRHPPVTSLRTLFWLARAVARVFRRWPTK